MVDNRVSKRIEVKRKGAVARLQQSLENEKYFNKWSVDLIRNGRKE